jgi:hypothetical protein
MTRWTYDATRNLRLARLPTLAEVTQLRMAELEEHYRYIDHLYRRDGVFRRMRLDRISEVANRVTGETEKILEDYPA